VLALIIIEARTHYSVYRPGLFLLPSLSEKQKVGGWARRRKEIKGRRKPN
jgi:hypothetical protein